MKKIKQFLGIMLSLVMVVGLMPGMSMTALADDPYESIKNTKTVVNFDRKKWYLIDYDSSTVTLLSKDCVDASRFNLNISNTYSGSEVEAVVNNYYTEYISEDAKTAVNGNGMFLLTTDQANSLSILIRPCVEYKGADFDAWWLCSPGIEDDNAACVSCDDGHIFDDGYEVYFKLGVRPALKLNLSSVIFHSTSKTFSLNPEEYEVTYKVAHGTWSDGRTEDKTESVHKGEKPVGVPAGMKASEGYLGGAWDTNPANVTIMGDTTFTYTFTAKQPATVTNVPEAKILTYTGSAQELVTAGKADGGTMQYAFSIDATTAPTSGWTASIPTATDVGKYYVWYKAVGDEKHIDSDSGCVVSKITDNFVVAFDMNGHGDAVSPVEVKEGDKVKKPAIPKASGWKFGGWYTDKKCTKAYNFDTPVTRSIILYAKWTEEQVKTVDMHRLYNPNSGEHFYTASVKEKEDLVKAGWKYEGLAWKAPVKSKTPVYRLYNPNAGDHHYTISASEKDNLVKAGWKDEGIGWYSDDANTKPVYRAYNPNAATGAHHFTLSKDEIKDLVKAGWKDEGIAFYSK